MSSFYLAPALIALRDEIDARFPRRDKSSDGWIGDTSHAARKSDHNPDWSAGGVVRAIDIDIDDRDPTRDLAADVIKACIGDPRVWYVIYRGVIYSRTYGFAARKYTGSNPHDHHVHVSIQGANGISASAATAIANNTSPWLDPIKVRVNPPKIDLVEVRRQMLAARDGKNVERSKYVRRLQRALNARYGFSLATDGLAGEATLAAYGHHERATGISGGPRIPDRRSLPMLCRGLYQVVDVPATKTRKKK